MGLEINGPRGGAGGSTRGGVVRLAQKVNEVPLDMACVLELVDQEDPRLVAHRTGNLRSVAKKLARQAQKVPKSQGPRPGLRRDEPGCDVLQERYDGDLTGRQVGQLPQERGQRATSFAFGSAGKGADKLVQLVVRRKPPCTRRQSGREQVRDGRREGVRERLRIVHRFEDRVEARRWGAKASAARLGNTLGNRAELGQGKPPVRDMVGEAKVARRQSVFGKAIQKASGLST